MGGGHAPARSGSFGTDGCTAGWVRRGLGGCVRFAGLPRGHVRSSGRRCGGTVDITQLILDDHHEQRRLFAILEQIDRSETGVLSAIWDRLAAFLELHAEAEEEIFYPALLQVGLAAQRKAGVEDETLDAIKDHNEIRDAVAEVARHQVGTDDWFTAVAGANEATGG